MSNACFVLWFIVILQIADALHFSYFLTVAGTCFDNGSNSIFMLEGWGAVARVTMVIGVVWEIGGAIGGTHGGDIGGGVGC